MRGPGTPSPFDARLARVTAGESLAAPELAALAASPDILPLGMLAEAVRRRLHGTQVTYLRVATYAIDQTAPAAFPPAAREIRITGIPGTLRAAVTAVEAVKAQAGDRVLSGFSWGEVDRVALAAGVPLSQALGTLHAAGLDALASVPLDAVGDAAAVVACLVGAGFQRLRFTIEKAAAADRLALVERAAALQAQYGCIQVLNPLPAFSRVSGPTTGYDDVKAVALARLAAPNVPTIQVDWLRYGPKLAQVALAFGADDLDSVSAVDEAPEGRRRAPIEEVRRNIVAAGLSAAERDGRFNLVS